MSAVWSNSRVDISDVQQQVCEVVTVTKSIDIAPWFPVKKWQWQKLQLDKKCWEPVKLVPHTNETSSTKELFSVYLPFRSIVLIV